MTLKGGETMSVEAIREIQRVEEEMEADLQGDPIDIAFNARYLVDVIKNVDDQDLYMNFNSSVSPCVVMPPSGEQSLTNTNSTF